MDNFKSYITLIENQWYWRIDDYGSTYKSTLSETEVYNVLEPFFRKQKNNGASRWQLRNACS